MKKSLFLLLLGSTLLLSESLDTNDLIKSHSPYLLQHAHNPVNWKPFSERVFEVAKKEKKLIFLSIGYSTCHWCHVMEKESFEDEGIAKILNNGYISVKVDKEEMPQIDTHYQHLHSLLKKGRNGWPLSVILNAKGEVIYIGTYIPVEDNYGIEGMKNLLPRLSKLDIKAVEDIVKENHKKIENNSILKKSDNNASVISLYMDKMKIRYDKLYKGFDKRPRFPLASHLNFLLDIYLLEGNKEAYKMAKGSLDAMAKGGIYDQIEGGFYRYSTDPDWIVPHFEKMLYTQAELIPLYVKLYQLSGDALYKRIVVETIKESMKIFEYDGLFYTATDADSEGREGGYFIYKYDNVKQALVKEGYTATEIEENLDYFDIYDIGNFEDGFSNPQFHTGIDELPAKFEQTKVILQTLRSRKTFPFIDKKIITSWNALMIKSLFIASKIEPSFLPQAKKSLEKLLKKMYHDSTLYHSFLAPHPPSQKAFFEDYAFLIDVLLEGYSVTYEEQYLGLAKELTDDAIKKFYKKGKWYLDVAYFAQAQYKDKYYTSPLARFYHGMISLASLEYDLAFLEKIKGFLKEERVRIIANVDKSPEAARALVRIESENIVLKSSKANLLNSKELIDKIRYPFLLKKVDKTEMYLLCNEQTCFFYDKNIKKVIKRMENLKK